MKTWWLLAASLYAVQSLPLKPPQNAGDVLDVFYAGVRIEVPITLVNNCDWPQTALLVFRDDQNRVTRGSITAAGKGTATQTASVTPGFPDLAADPPFALLDISAYHGEHTQGGKICLPSNPKYFLEADDALQGGPRGAPSRSVTAKTFTITLTQTVAEDPKKKVVTDTRATPPAAQMPGGAPVPGDKPGDKPAEKPADKPSEKPPETSGGRPSASPLPKRDPGRLIPPPPVNKPPLRASPLETPASPAAPTPAAPGKPATPDGPKPPDKSPPPTTTTRPVDGIGDLWDVLFGIPVGDPSLPTTMEDLRREILGREDPWTYEELDKDREHPEQKEMLPRFEFEIEPTDVMEPDPIALISRAGRALMAWVRRPAYVGSALAAAAAPLDPRVARVRGSRGEQVRPQDVSVAFIATGEASGPAFIVKVLNRTGKRVNVSLSDGVILAPAAGTLPARAVNARGTSSHTIVGYCVEHAKLTPSAGAIFAVAPPSVQQRYKSVTNVLRSGRLLDRFKRLSPQQDAENYGHSVRQWALWTKLEGWNRERFTSQFVERTKKNISDMKGKWTKDVEKVVRDGAVTRWTDIGKILQIGQWIDVNEKELRRK